jgi:hypothetical protein
MESSYWQQEQMQKHRVLATAQGRTLCFYSHNGSEKTRTLEGSVALMAWAFRPSPLRPLELPQTRLRIALQRRFAVSVEHA